MILKDVYQFVPHPNLLPEGEGIAIDRAIESNIMGFRGQALVINGQNAKSADKIQTR